MGTNDRQRHCYGDTWQQDAELVALLKAGHALKAVKRVRDLTDCPFGKAKEWVVAQLLPEPAPCPYCGKSLATAQAEQCFACGMDWRDPDCVVRRGKPDVGIHCCEAMEREAERVCEQHPKRFDCPDCLIHYSGRFREYGLIVHDGGTASVRIEFCPWCGRRLPESKRTIP